MTIEISRLTPALLPGAQEVYRQSFGDSPFWTEIAHRFGQGAGIFVVAVAIDTQTVVGIKFGFIEGEACIGRGIAVRPEYRRQGIATRMLRFFEAELRRCPQVRRYAFGSATLEGIPFHIASGYCPTALIQFTDPTLRASLNFSGYEISREGYNEEYRVYQVFLPLRPTDAGLEGLRKLQESYPETNVQFFFEKEITHPLLLPE